jgi:prepilin-type N-terminal cleavage/methylation domain-containing protein
MRRGGAAGFTLIEIVIALTLVAALLAITFSGLRVGLAAWRQGDARAEQLQRGRSLNQLLVRAVGGAHPYRLDAGGPEPAPPAFRGERDRLTFVTARPPVPLAAPIAFTAVSLSLEDRGLTIREAALPSRDLFGALVPVLADPGVVALQFRYLRGHDRTWGERWDGIAEHELPAAVEITLTDQPPVVIPIRVNAP